LEFWSIDHVTLNLIEVNGPVDIVMELVDVLKY